MLACAELSSPGKLESTPDRLCRTNAAQFAAALLPLLKALMILSVIL